MAGNQYLTAPQAIRRIMAAALRPRDLHGLMAVWKPLGASSMDVLRVMKKILNDPSVKVGHGGTLDPLAQGLLVVGINRGCAHLSSMLTGCEKEYHCRARLGVSTDSYDMEGTVTSERPADGVTAEAIETQLAKFRGSYAQLPPRFSAKRIGGVRSYVLARSGQPMPAPKPVQVTVNALSMTGFETPEVELSMRVSSGFYVRSLVHDLGEALGTGAVMTYLLRTAQGPFKIDEAVMLGDLSLAVIAEKLKMPPRAPTSPPPPPQQQQQVKRAVYKEAPAWHGSGPGPASKRMERQRRPEAPPAVSAEEAARRRAKSDELWRALVAERHRM